jgi:hypothetical protein
MQRWLQIAVSAFFIVAANHAHGAAPVAIHNQGWTITADQDRSVLSISQQELGMILKDVRISVGDQPLSGWSAEQTSQWQLTIHTAHPMTAWSFDVSHNMLKISSTATNGLLTAQAPASSNRIPARVLDPQGFPVDWIGTDEAPLEYGGTETRNQSYLPLKNPEVMYFALGQVSGAAFHR